MKFNLKNFPDWKKRDNLYDYDTWKEGFEAELREKLKFATMYKLKSDYPRDAKLIKEILGE